MSTDRTPSPSTTAVATPIFDALLAELIAGELTTSSTAETDKPDSARP